MQPMQIYVTEEQHKKLKMIYALTGERMTEVVRKAIDYYLEKEEVEKK